jgi:NADH-ubiquinone oxidoreductase chain 6
MHGLYIFTGDNFINGYIVDILDLFYLAAIICGILVIISKNPIISVLFLIGLFLSVSSYLITLGVNFIGLSYLLVYVGAVSILFLFILMLINVRISELLSNTSNSIPLAIILGICFYYTVSEILPSNHTSSNSFLDLRISNSEMSYKINTGFINKILSVFSDKGEIIFVTSKT